MSRDTDWQPMPMDDPDQIVYDQDGFQYRVGDEVDHDGLMLWFDPEDEVGFRRYKWSDVEGQGDGYLYDQPQQTTPPRAEPPTRTPVEVLESLLGKAIVYVSLEDMNGLISDADPEEFEFLLKWSEKVIDSVLDEDDDGEI